MISKKIAVVAMALSSMWYTQIQAQGGFKIGINLAHMSEQSLYAKSKILPRLQLGFVFKPIKLSDKTNVTTEMLMTWKGQHYTYQETYETVSSTRTIKTDYKDKFTYWEMPVLVATTLTNKLQVQFGPIFSLRFSGKKSGKTNLSVYDKTSKTSTNQEFNEDARYGDKDKYPSGTEGLFSGPLKTFEMSLALGASYRVFPKIAVYGRYVYGLSDVFNNNYPFKNASGTKEINKGIQFGVLFLFKSNN